MRILVVDDSRAMRMMLQRCIRQADGYGDVEFVEAADGAEALEVLERDRSLDVVVSDWNMPNVTGMELLGRLRGAGNHVPFGFVTSEATVEASAEAFAAGACFHCTKPFTPEALEVALDWATGRCGDEPPALPANVRLGAAP